MLKLAANSGTTDIVATPHASVEYPFDELRIAEAFRTVSALAGGTIRVHLGCDFHLDYRNLRDALENPAKYAINGAAYLMVELPEAVAFQVTRQALKQLLRTGVVPVITHPERNGSFQQRPDELGPLIKDGCLLQLTGQSILGSFGTTAARVSHELLEKGLVHFVASDAHDCVRRSPNLAAPRDYITDRYGAAVADRLLHVNPEATLSGRDLPKAVKSRKPLRFFARD